MKQIESKTAMMKSSLKMLSVLVFLLVGVVACTPDAPEQSQALPTAEATVTAESTEQPSSELPAVDTFVFYDSYAQWCSTCRYNAPIVQSLQERFAGKMTVVTFNIEALSDEQRAKWEAIGFRDRSQYALVNERTGEVLVRWYGTLNEERVASEIEAFLN